MIYTYIKKYDIIIVGDSVKKNVFYVLSVVAIITFILICFYFITKEDTLLKKPKTIKNIVFKDVDIEETDHGYVFYVTLEATKDVNMDRFDVFIYDKNNEKIDILTENIGEKKKGEKKEVKIPSNKNLKNAYSVSYTVYE